MTIPFIQKYTPRNLRDFFYEHSFKYAIQNLLDVDFLNILFIGNAGVGKTSIINALINEYYCKHNKEFSEEPPESNRLDSNVLYINNLNEQGISYYRSEVKTFCQTKCTIANKKKILVIDDLDMISLHSQQEFRNCMDSYGNNIHFIASCTNTQEVINSIQSRTSIIHLYPLSHDSQMNIIDHIIQTENINMTKKMKECIIRISDNSTSLLINYLEKCKLLGNDVNEENIYNISTTLSHYIFDDYINYCIKMDVKNAINVLYELYDKGYSVIDIFDSFFCYIKQTNAIDDAHKYAIVSYISNYITIFYNTHEDEIELAIMTKNIIDVFKPLNK